MPKKLSDRNIATLIRKKTNWIRQKLQLHKDSKPDIPKEYVSGESFAYLGRHYRLKFLEGPKATVRLINGRLIMTLPKAQKTAENCRNALEKWYRFHAEAKLRDKLSRFAMLLATSTRNRPVYQT